MLEFSPSAIMEEYRKKNDDGTAVHRDGQNFKLKEIITVLLNNPPPNSNVLKEEGSGMAKIEMYMNQTEAEFKRHVTGPGDENVLNGLGTDIIRAASDFHWANFICSHLIPKETSRAHKKLY